MSDDDLFSFVPRAARDRFRSTFAEHGVVVFPGLLDTHIGHLLQRTAGLAVDEFGVRRDFLMSQTGGTPRRMSVVNGLQMARYPAVRAVYAARGTLDFLSEVVAESVVCCPERVEDVIVTELSCQGDTHGWHFDDYPLALILILETPPATAGGVVEYRDATGTLRSLGLRSGDAYLMRTDRLEHRVSEIVDPGSVRRILNFTYAIAGAMVEPNGTAHRLLS